MISKKFLDSLYSELYKAHAQVDELVRTDTFPAEEGCGCSIRAERHDVALKAATERVERADRTIANYIASCNNSQP